MTAQPESGFRARLRCGELCLGSCITFTDPTVTEALTNVMDFVWIDMEHNPLTLPIVQGHIMATKGSETTPLVRVAWNDPVLIKPVLDIGAAGVIVPWIRTADDARKAVAACRYPPDGIRGFGPRRPSAYGLHRGPEFCRSANESVITVVQIEHIDAVENLDEILAVPGITAIVVGSNDLSGSMGHMGETRHPEVLHAIHTVIEKALAAKVPVGMALGDDVDELSEWVDRGVQWLSMGNDFSMMLRTAGALSDRLRERARPGAERTQQG